MSRRKPLPMEAQESTLLLSSNTMSETSDFLYNKKQEPMVANEDRERDELLPHRNENQQENRSRRPKKTLLLWMISLIGVASFCLILTQGITAERQSKQDDFRRMAEYIVFRFQLAIEDYVQAALWLHETCFDYHKNDGSGTLISHETFEQHVYPAFLKSNARTSYPISIVVNNSHAERESVENDTRAYLNKRKPDFNYTGVRRLTSYATDVVDNVITPGAVYEPQSEQPFYLLMRRIAPLLEEDPLLMFNNVDMIDLDLNSFPDITEAFAKATQTGTPNMLMPVCFDVPADEPSFFTCTTDILHPGAQSNTHNGTIYRNDVLRSASEITVWINNLFMEVNQMLVNRHVWLYLFDNLVEESVTEPQQPMLIGAAQLGLLGQQQLLEGITERTNLKPTYLPYSNFSHIGAMVRKYTYQTQIDIDLYNRKWSFVFAAAQEDFPTQTKYIILGASVMLVACLGLALWVHTDHQRKTKMDILQERAKAEKAALKVENARLTARKERELNDFIAHEVRNPISAALSACSFLTTAVQESSTNSAPWTSAKRKAIEDDVKIIDNSLSFINDLLRNMLDLHRTQSNQLKLNPAPLSVYSDILEPVASMLRQHSQPFSVLVECDPADLVILADKLRLKQIVLNLGRNSVKFVTKGYVRLKAQISEENGMVELLVQDSGPGIPLEKRSRLFSKFQESLDSLHQGTGIGLSLCQMLIDLMGGEIKLDDGYDSGIPGFLGASFVIRLNTPPLVFLPPATEGEVSDPSSSSLVTTPQMEEEKDDRQHSGHNHIVVFPEKLSVLICDDDLMLRKMFLRSVKRVAPLWDLSEAANGETGLQLARKTNYDIIFLDQYMASVSKQMLGTETAMAMRSAGITSVLCGLSANDMEKSFLDAGANAFIMKPFPCNPGPLKEALTRVVQHLPTEEQQVSSV